MIYKKKNIIVKRQIIKFPYGICNQFSKKLEAPPWTITVIITINDVVVNMACRASDTVFRIAKANDIAPLSPAKNSICWKFHAIFGLRPRFNNHDSGYTLTARPSNAQHYHVQKQTIKSTNRN